MRRTSYFVEDFLLQTEELPWEKVGILLCLYSPVQPIGLVRGEKQRLITPRLQICCVINSGGQLVQDSNTSVCKFMNLE